MTKPLEIFVSDIVSLSYSSFPAKKQRCLLEGIPWSAWIRFLMALIVSPVLTIILISFKEVERRILT